MAHLFSMSEPPHVARALHTYWGEEEEEEVTHAYIDCAVASSAINIFQSGTSTTSTSALFSWYTCCFKYPFSFPESH